MGLSNEERIKGIYHAINSIVEIVNSSKKEDLGKLPQFIDNLWHSFLGKAHNAAHWLLGSSASNSVTWETTTPWGVSAINYHCDGIMNEEPDIFAKKEDFDAFEGFLDIHGLLSQAGREFKAIYDIYAWSEQLIYYLRRYDDDFLKDLEALSKLVSDIQGECFNLFRQDEAYAKAYILNIICKMIYGNQYPYSKDKWDSLTKYLSAENMHHDLSRPMTEGPLKFLAEIHTELYQAQKSKKLTIMLRTKTLLKISGRRYQYDHQFKKLVKMLKLKKKDLQELELLFAECKKAHEEKEKVALNRNDSFSPLSIYGLSFEFSGRRKK